MATYSIISNELINAQRGMVSPALRAFSPGRPNFAALLAKHAAPATPSVSSNNDLPSRLNHLLKLLQAQSLGVPAHLRPQVGASKPAEPPAPSATKPESKPPKNGSFIPTPADIEKHILAAARKNGIDPNLVRAVVQAESNFDPGATSHVGAMGLMQLMPGTAKDLGVSNPYDARQNVMGGAKYLKQLIDRYGGNVSKALAAYNWGMGNVERKGLVKMPSETRTYIQRVMGNWGRYASAGPTKA